MRTLRPYRAARYCFSACGLELGAARHTDSAPITSGTDGGRAYALRNAIQSLSDLVGVVHFFPGSSVFSLGTAACNLACQFCQNWDTAKARDLDRLTDQASPHAIAQAARSHGAKSVAFTYNDPVAFLEYAMDTADACHDMGLKTVAVTAGYIHDVPRREFFAKMDAAKIDLKGFAEGFYLGLCGGHLQPVLDTLAYVHHETDCWLEITNLLIPGRNDSDAEVGGLSKWVATELGRDVPLHFSTFHPNWNLVCRTTASQG